jgi:hypothetical protein
MPTSKQVATAGRSRAAGPREREQLDRLHRKLLAHIMDDG